jgi:hypothetical protein
MRSLGFRSVATGAGGAERDPEPNLERRDVDA